MTEPLRVGQFAIVDHEPVDRGPNAGIFHGKGPHDDRAELFIVAEGTTPAGEAFAGHVVSALGHAFGSLDMSLTGALRRLFLEADQNVRDWNARSISQHTVSLGLSCFARRGGQVVVAQAGPTVAFHLSGKRITVYGPDEEHSSAIGVTPTTPQLARIPFEPGDRLLMITTSAVEALDDEIIGGILSLPEEQVLADLYRRLDHLRHVTALLVTTAESEVRTKAAPAKEPDEVTIIDATLPGHGVRGSDTRNIYQPSLFIDDKGADAIDFARRQLLQMRPRSRVTAVMPAILAEVPMPLRRASGDGGLAVLAAQSHARAVQSRELVNSVSLAQPPWRQPGADPSFAEADGIVRRHRHAGSFSRGLMREEAKPSPSPVTMDAPPCDELAEDTRLRTEAALSGPIAATIAGESVASVNAGGSLVRMRDDMGRRKRSSGGGAVGGGQLPPTWLVILGGLGILIALVGLIALPRAFGGGNGDRYATLIDGAQQQLAAARALPDLAKRRDALTAARGMLLEAQEVDAAAVAETGLAAEIDRELGLMDNVRTPRLVEPVASLEEFGQKPVSVTRMAVSDTAAYLLNSNGGQVIGVALATGGRQVIFETNKEARHGAPLAIAWVDSSDFAGAAVIIADANHTLWAYGSRGLQPLALASPEGLQVTDIATFEGDLYVLDAHQSTVFRFGQTSQGYSNAPTKLLETPDLAAARRLMVDGELVTADANGALRRFTNQTVLVLSQAGINERLVKDELVQPVERRGDLAVLDAPNDRIVVLRRDGTFDRQYRHKDLRAMTAFAIRNGVAYVFAGGQLRRITW